MAIFGNFILTLSVTLKHNHKKWKDNLKTRVVLIEISILCRNLPDGLKHRGSRKRNINLSAENQIFSGDFRANLEETNTEKKEMDYLTSRILLEKAYSYKCQFYSKVCVSSRLVPQGQVMAWQKIKKKYLMCQILINMLKQHGSLNSSLQNIKIYSSKECRVNI